MRKANSQSSLVDTWTYRKRLKDERQAQFLRRSAARRRLPVRRPGRRLASRRTQGSLSGGRPRGRRGAPGSAPAPQSGKRLRSRRQRPRSRPPHRQPRVPHRLPLPRCRQPSASSPPGPGTSADAPYEGIGRRGRGGPPCGVGRTGCCDRGEPLPVRGRGARRPGRPRRAVLGGSDRRELRGDMPADSELPSPAPSGRSTCAPPSPGR